MIVVGNNPLAPTYTPHRGSNITMVIIFEIIHIQPRPLFVIWRIEIIQSAVGHHGLVFEDILQRALRYFCLIGGIGCGITETDVTDVEYRKWTIAKKIGHFMGLTYLGDGVFEKIKISE